MSNTSYFAGLDIGGTTIKALLIDAQANPVGTTEIPSLVQQGFRRTFVQLHEALRLLSVKTGVSPESIRAVGLDVPAPCSKGVIWGKANLAQDWVGTNIEQEFAREIKKPVIMANDGNAAAYGEWLYRKDRHQGGLLFVAPGTGLGGGLVLPGGHMYEGTNGLALEVSDITVPFEEDDGSVPADALGRERCLEAWVSLVGLRRTLQIKLSQPQHAGHELNREGGTIVEKAFKLRDYAAKGDPLAVEIFRRQAHILGYGLADLTSLFDPGLIVIGGGLAETSFRDWYLDAVEEGFHLRAAPFYRYSPLPPHPKTTTFEWAIGGDNSAAYGVARRVMDLV